MNFGGTSWRARSSPITWRGRAPTSWSSLSSTTTVPRGRSIRTSSRSAVQPRGRIGSATVPAWPHRCGRWRRQTSCTFTACGGCISYRRARAAKRVEVPVIVTVHGMLHPPALRQRGAFKRAARWMFRTRCCARRAACTRRRKRKPPRSARSDSNSRSRSSHGALDMPAGERPDRGSSGGTHVLLFLGRLHPPKDWSRCCAPGPSSFGASRRGGWCSRATTKTTTKRC